MAWVDLISVLALLQYFFFGLLVGRARGRYGVKAPSTTGNEIFERLYRVQMNTLELLVVVLPAMYLAARYWPPALVAGVGAIYLLGRVVYWRSYITVPASRALGFGLSAFPTLALLFATLVGLVLAALK